MVWWCSAYTVSPHPCLQVGAQTETELKEKKLRVEDALNATKVGLLFQLFLILSHGFYPTPKFGRPGKRPVKVGWA